MHLWIIHLWDDALQCWLWFGLDFFFLFGFYFYDHCSFMNVFFLLLFFKSNNSKFHFFMTWKLNDKYLQFGFLLFNCKEKRVCIKLYNLIFICIDFRLKHQIIGAKFTSIRKNPKTFIVLGTNCLNLKHQNGYTPLSQLGILATISTDINLFLAYATTKQNAYIQYPELLEWCMEHLANHNCGRWALRVMP